MILRLNIALAVALVLSSFWLIDSSYQSRRLFVALEKSKAHASELQIEFERLEVEKRAQATPLRVEKLARSKLKMFDSSPARTHYMALSETGQVISSSPARVVEAVQ